MPDPLPPMPPKEGEMAKPAIPPQGAGAGPAQPTKPLAKPPLPKKQDWTPIDVSRNKLFRNTELLGRRESVVRGIRQDLAGTLSKFSQKTEVAKALAKAGARGYLSKGKIKDVLAEQVKAGKLNASQVRRLKRKYGAF